LAIAGIELDDLFHGKVCREVEVEVRLADEPFDILSARWRCEGSNVSVVFPMSVDFDRVSIGEYSYWYASLLRNLWIISPKYSGPVITACPGFWISFMAEKTDLSRGSAVLGSSHISIRKAMTAY
jgi:hypothetical protein